MVVCHCEAVNDRVINAALQDGSTSLSEIEQACGAGGQCGGCVDTIRHLLARRNEAAVALPA